jgi:outer membrane protein insertion porin family
LFTLPAQGIHAARIRTAMRSAALVGLLITCFAAAQPPPGRVYVRHIEFQEVTRINDEVLRREMLQLESAVLDTVALEQSRLRLEALPFVASARVGLRPVEGTLDLVDVVVVIEEAPARRYGGGGAYSESLRGSLYGYFTNENLFGTGQRLSLQVEGSPLQSIVEVTHTEPYARPAGVSRTITLSGRSIDQLTADTSDLRADLYHLVLEYGYRVGEAQTLRLGTALRDTDLMAGAETSSQLSDWIARNGNPRADTRPATHFREVDFLLQWRHDTRDRTVFPNRGLEQTVSLRSALPGSAVEYFLLNYRIASHRPLGEQWTASLSARLGYGASYGGRTTSLPPYLHWFAGGPDSVRGFRENRLGPRDSLGNPYGGNLLATGRFELMRPLPGRWAERIRFGFFYDVGSVFSTEDVTFADDAGERLDYGFDFSELRHSAGVAVHWLIPLGTLRLSYGIPLNADDDHPNRFLRDGVDRTQISFGVGVGF